MTDVHIYHGYNIENIRVKATVGSDNVGLKDGVLVIDSLTSTDWWFPESHKHILKLRQELITDLEYHAGNWDVHIVTHSEQILPLLTSGEVANIDMVYVHQVSDDNSIILYTEGFSAANKKITLDGFVKTKCKDGIFWVKYHNPDFFIQINDAHTEMTIYNDGLVTVFPLGET